METKQPEALRLADWCDEHSSGIYRPSAQAAAELRRLLAENETLRTGYDAARLEIASLQAQLEAAGAGWCDGCSPDNCGGCATWVAPVPAVQQDAERYRWLREYAIGAYITAQGKGSTAIYLLTKVPALDGIGEETDAAIDAARGAVPVDAQHSTACLYHYALSRLGLSDNTGMRVLFWDAHNSLSWDTKTDWYVMPDADKADCEQCNAARAAERKP